MLLITSHEYYVLFCIHSFSAIKFKPTDALSVLGPVVAHAWLGILWPVGGCPRLGIGHS